MYTALVLIRGKTGVAPQLRDILPVKSVSPVVARSRYFMLACLKPFLLEECSALSIKGQACWVRPPSVKEYYC